LGIFGRRKGEVMVKYATPNTVQKKPTVMKSSVSKP
jgi:hypothetical protein